MANCSKCGAEVEEGRPFCPQCRAPQIRVVSAATEPGTDPLPPGTPGEVQPPAEPIDSPRDSAFGAPPPPPPLPPRVQPQPSRLRYRYVVPGAIILGLLTFIGSVTQFAPLLLLCFIAGGGITVAIYHRRAHTGDLRPGTGFRIGALSGAMGFVVYFVLSIIPLASPSGRDEMREALRKGLDSAVAANPDPAKAELARKMTESLTGTTGLVVFTLVSLLIFGALLILLSGLGGSIGAYLFGKHHTETHS